VSTYWVDLLGCEVRFVGHRHRSRIIEFGAGPPLILLHGTGGHAENWVRNIKPLGAHFRVIAPDFLWHGASDTDGFEPEIMPGLVGQVLDIMDALGIARAHVEGQSLGGWVAALLAMRHPERVQKLILTVPMGYLPDAGAIPGYAPMDFGPLRAASLACLADPNWTAMRTRVERLVADPAIVPDEAIAVRQRFYQDPAVNAAQVQVITHYLGGEAPLRHALTDAGLRGITHPTLVYWGEKNLTPPVLGERIAAQIPGARYHCNPATGHWAQFENHADHDRVVLDFLQAA
jgi:2-hydroxy-6-oxonona-2,4-dienedioate hydrolase